MPTPRPLPGTTTASDQILYARHFYTLPRTERETLIRDSQPLCTMLEAALEAYCRAHSDITESMRLYAVDQLHRRTKKRLWLLDDAVLS